MSACCAGDVKYESANSCLVPLCSVDGVHVITTEGVGSKSKGYHPVQNALASHNGSQCGFCSVGWTMQAYSLFQREAKISDVEVENSFAGNLCR